MISLEAIRYIEKLLSAREIENFYLDVFQVPLADQMRRVYTDANRGFFYLISHQLPVGTTIASESSVLFVDEKWNDKTITKVQEFSGQIAIELPENHGLKQIEFIRAIPR